MVKQCSDMCRKGCGILFNNVQKVVTRGSARVHQEVSQGSGRGQRGVIGIFSYDHFYYILYYYIC